MKLTARACFSNFKYFLNHSSLKFHSIYPTTYVSKNYFWYNRFRAKKENIFKIKLNNASALTYYLNTRLNPNSLRINTWLFPNGFQFFFCFFFFVKVSDENEYCNCIVEERVGVAFFFKLFCFRSCIVYSFKRKGGII